MSDLVPNKLISGTRKSISLQNQASVSGFDLIFLTKLINFT